jgi:predicted transcriptional regulator
MMNKSPQTLLAEIQANSGLGQCALATLLGIAQPTVSRILSGKADSRGSTLTAIQQLHKKVRRKKTVPVAGGISE